MPQEGTKAGCTVWLPCGRWSPHSGFAATPAIPYDILSRGQDGHLLLASPPGGDRLCTLLPASWTPRSRAEGGPRPHTGRYDGPWLQPSALPADRSGPLGHPSHHLETGQGVQGTAAGDPSPVRSLAALRGAPRDFCGHECAHRPPGAVTRPAAWPSRRIPAGPQPQRQRRVLFRRYHSTHEQGKRPSAGGTDGGMFVDAV